PDRFEYEESNPADPEKVVIYSHVFGHQKKRRTTHLRGFFAFMLSKMGMYSDTTETHYKRS
ncbi:MAG: hypothetical protein J6O43_02805, partial [Clostridium sp.]|nr:hypothetical protein [Clostridium sp.]